MQRADVPTPALVLDLDRLDANVARMMERARNAGVAVRAHAKSHKCVEIARRLAAAGAIGSCCATVEEAEALAAGGVAGLLVTSPQVSAAALDRIGRLLTRRADLMLVADSTAGVDGAAAVAAAHGVVLPLVVELDVGVGRTGCADIPAAVALARRIAATPSLRFAGIQAYWGNLQQVMPLTERRARIDVQAARLKDAISALAAVGLPPAIVTGSGTGTHAIDAALGLFTELQPGSFLFLDSCYGAIPLDDAGNPFEPSLFLAASVVTASRPGRAIVNAGFKAFATDSGLPVATRGFPAGAIYRFMGDEHGAVDFAGEGPALGVVAEFLTSHCDPTVNLHDRYYVVRGEDVVDIWPIARGYRGRL